MSALDELGVALECVTGARDALRRALASDGLPEDRTEAMVFRHHLRKFDVQLAGVHAKLSAVYNVRREVER